MDINLESASPSTDPLRSSRFLPPLIPTQSINPAQLHYNTHRATSDTVKGEDTPSRLAYPSTSTDTSSDTQLSSYGSMAIIEAYPKANIFHVRLHYRNPSVDENALNPKFKIYLDNVPLKTVIILAPDGTLELRGTMLPNSSLVDPVKVSIQAILDNENDAFDSVCLGMYNANELMAGD